HIDRLMTAVPLSIEKRIFRDLRLAYPGAAPQQGRAQAEAMIGRRIGEIWADGHLEGLHDEGPRPTERQAVAFDFLLDSYAQGKVAANTDRATLLLARSGCDHFGPAVVRMAEVESDELAPKWADAVANRLFSLTHVLRRPNSTPLRIRVPHLENARIRALTDGLAARPLRPAFATALVERLRQQQDDLNDGIRMLDAGLAHGVFDARDRDAARAVQTRLAIESPTIQALCTKLAADASK
ncbi:MAG: hypothetical protein AAFV29_21695, partial [Myxococcota bacterium]